MKSYDLKENIVLYSNDLTYDRLVINTLMKYFKGIKVIHNKTEIKLFLQDQTPKIFFIATETLSETLEIFYNNLAVVKSSEICNYKLIAMVLRHDEEKAFEAYINGLIDNYLISRPLYETHRVPIIANEALLKLGIVTWNKDALGYLYTACNYDDELKRIISEALEKKVQYAKSLEASIIRIEQALDNAASKIQAHQHVTLDMKALKHTLSKICQDEVKPEMLKIQSKALLLLESVLGDLEDLPEKTVTNESSHDIAHKDVSNKAVTNEFSHDIGNKGVSNKTKHIAPNVNTKPKILLIEDDEISVNLTSCVLKKFKVEFEVVTSGRRAFALMNTKKFDLIFIDLNLPDTNGLYLIDLVSRDNQINTSTPKIMLTGNSNKATVKQAIEMGASGYMLKPLYEESFSKLLRKFELSRERSHE